MNIELMFLEYPNRLKGEEISKEEQEILKRIIEELYEIGKSCTINREI